METVSFGNFSKIFFYYYVLILGFFFWKKKLFLIRNMKIIFIEKFFCDIGFKIFKEYFHKILAQKYKKNFLCIYFKVIIKIKKKVFQKFTKFSNFMFDKKKIQEKNSLDFGLYFSSRKFLKKNKYGLVNENNNDFFFKNFSKIKTYFKIECFLCRQISKKKELVDVNCIYYQKKINLKNSSAIINSKLSTFHKCIACNHYSKTFHTNLIFDWKVVWIKSAFKKEKNCMKFNILFFIVSFWKDKTEKLRLNKILLCSGMTYFCFLFCHNVSFFLPRLSSREVFSKIKEKLKKKCVLIKCRKTNILIENSIKHLRKKLKKLNLKKKKLKKFNKLFSFFKNQKKIKKTQLLFFFSLNNLLLSTKINYFKII
ncbi:hypothetical protein CMESO_321 (nucleomorph) [Chroomonas mesostigmatica CCMP1168]|uniref:Uncharacterized protein n=1 Tax=Chroomonas mesostigmatica CCMP1168 TaxID=1195612 RepID=J7G371_9CRYP|nr:hypothetical protein CMESO_321 [Chroomonas mesostigmatica CCMP1168]